MNYKGDLIITKENASEFVWLTSVSGRLNVEAKFQAPALTSVGRLACACGLIFKRLR